jgi:hypothetical protein
MTHQPDAPHSLRVKLLKAGDARRRSRFHTARGDPISSFAWRRLPLTMGWILLPRLTRWRPTIPWIPFSAIRALAQRLTPDAQVLEIGSGMSTLWLARRCSRLVSIEADEQWFQRVRELLRRRRLNHVELRYRWRALEMSDFTEFPDRSLDLVVVDGGPREQCLLAAVPKVRPGGVVYVDNTDEPQIAGCCRERLVEIAASTGGRLDYHRDFSPGNLYVSEGTLLTLPDPSS